MSEDEEEDEAVLRGRVRPHAIVPRARTAWSSTMGGASRWQREMFIKREEVKREEDVIKGCSSTFLLSVLFFLDEERTASSASRSTGPSSRTPATLPKVTPTLDPNPITFIP